VTAAVDAEQLSLPPLLLQLLLRALAHCTLRAVAMAVAAVGTLLTITTCAAWFWCCLLICSCCCRRLAVAAAWRSAHAGVLQHEGGALRLLQRCFLAALLAAVVVVLQPSAATPARKAAECASKVCKSMTDTSAKEVDQACS
jgi:hypothetical protein